MKLPEPGAVVLVRVRSQKGSRRRAGLVTATNHRFLAVVFSDWPGTKLRQAIFDYVTGSCRRLEATNGWLSARDLPSVAESYALLRRKRKRRRGC